MRKSIKLFIGLLAGLLALPLMGSHVLYLDLDELSLRSDVVARAQVLDRESRWDNEGNRIYTYTKLQVLSSLKGDEKGVIILRQLGGEVEGTGYFISGDAHFDEGEEVVVFLRRNPDGDPFYHLVGLAQGKFLVERDEDKVFAVRDTSDLSMIRRENGMMKPAGEGARISIGLDELTRAVQAAIEKR